MVKTQPARLKVIAFFDGRPGHEKQTRGILQALRESIELEVEEIQVQRNSMLDDLIGYLRLFIPHRRRDGLMSPDADLLIGTGSRTHLALLQAKRQMGLPAVISMTPNHLLFNRFDLIFAPNHDGVAPGKNIVFTVGPPNCARISGSKSPQRGLILIGGADPGSHFWDSESLEGYIREIARKDNGIGWTVSSSPRTPEDTVQRLETLACDIDNLDFFRFEDTARGWVEQQYDECEKVWVTADSMSMVYEALSAGCRVGLLPVRWRKSNSKFRRSEDYLIKESMVVPYFHWLSGRGTWQEKEPLNEARHCAEEILKRWPPKN
jgi:uncharacterized protein